MLYYGLKIWSLSQEVELLRWVAKYSFKLNNYDYNNYWQMIYPKLPVHIFNTLNPV